MDQDLFDLLDEIVVPVAPEWLEDFTPIPTIEGEAPNPLTFDREEELRDKAEGVVVWNEVNHKFSYFKSHADLEDFVYKTPNEYRTYHERIYANQPQKLRFDIDAKALEEGGAVRHQITLENVETIKDVICDTFIRVYRCVLDKRDIITCDSSDATKRSLHIIVDKYHVVNNVEAKYFAQRVREHLANELQPVLDMGIYKTATGLRLPLNHKAESERVKKLPTHVLFASALITYTNGCQCLAPQVKEAPINAVIADRDAANILVKIPPQYLLGLKFRNCRSGYLNFTRTDPSPCPISGEVHHNDNTVYAFANAKGAIQLKCRHCPGTKVVVKATKPSMADKVRECIEREAVPPILIADSNNEYEARFMRDYEDCNFIGVRAGMGLGKSEQIERQIAQSYALNPNLVTRIVSFRQTFTREMQRRYRSISYQDIDGPIDEVFKNVIVQVESLHRLVPTPPDLLIIDEIESVLNQFYAKTMSKYNTCWSMFQYLVKHSKKVIFMDAMLSQRSIDVLKAIRKEPVHLHTNTYKLLGDSTHFVTTVESVAVKKIVDSLTEGKKVVIPVTSCKLALTLHKLLADKFPTKSIRIYTSKTSEEVKKRDFANVNVAWMNHDALIYTPTVLAGVSFTLKWYDLVVAFWFDKSADVNSSMQMMRRVRDISSLTYFHCINATGNSLPDTLEAVEEFISAKYENIATQYTPLAGEIAVDGRVEYNKNAEYWAWVRYKTMNNCNKNRFIDIMVNELKLTGAKVEFWGGKSNGLKDIIIETQKEITAEDARKVATAREMREEEVKELDLKAAAGTLTDDDYFALRKYNLREHYNFDDDINAAFVLTYANTSTRRKYTNLKYITHFSRVGHSLNDITNLARNGFVDECKTLKELERFNHNKITESHIDNLEKHRTALKFVLDCGFQSLSDERVVTRAELLAKIRENHADYVSKCKYTCDLFETKMPTLPHINDEKMFMNMMRYINGKIFAQYDISISATDKKSTHYKLSKSEHFGSENQPKL